MKPSVRAPVSGPLGRQASHGPGTTGGGDGTAQVAQEVLVSTAARKLIPGATLNNSWLKDTIISMVMAMEKPANHSSDVALERMALGQVAAFVPSTSYAARTVAVVAGARHVI